MKRKIQNMLLKIIKQFFYLSTIFFFTITVQSCILQDNPDVFDASGNYKNTGHAGGSENTSPIVINETAASDDFIELYNNSSNDFDFKEGVWKASDDGGLNGDNVWVITNTSINGYGFMFLNNLSGIGTEDQVFLFSNGIEIDKTPAWTEKPDPSYARIPNGTGNFTISSEATPGSSNK